MSARDSRTRRLHYGCLTPKDILCVGHALDGSGDEQSYVKTQGRGKLHLPQCDCQYSVLAFDDLDLLDSPLKCSTPRLVRKQRCNIDGSGPRLLVGKFEIQLGA